MIRKLLVATLLLFFASSSAFAQGIKVGEVALTGEAEFTQDQKGNQSYDLYVFGHAHEIELLARATHVENSIHRAEFSVGKSFGLFPDKDKKPRVALTQYAGLTTDGAVYTPVSVVLNFFGRTGVYIADPKFYYYHGQPQSLHENTLYQKSSVSLTKAGGWQFRWERLRVVGNSTIFNRFGIERRIWVRNKMLGENSHFQISPFVDTAKKQVGFYAGFRWQ